MIEPLDETYQNELYRMIHINKSFLHLHLFWQRSTITLKLVTNGYWLYPDTISMALMIGELLSIASKQLIQNILYFPKTLLNLDFSRLNYH